MGLDRLILEVRRCLGHFISPEKLMPENLTGDNTVYLEFRQTLQ